MTTTQATAVVDCRNIGVRYGRIQALEQASFAVEPGQVYALLGRNGSGKTSLIRCLLGHQKPRTGRVDLFGQEVWSSRRALMQRVGVVAEEPDAPPLMTPRQLLKFCAGLYPRWDEAATTERLRRFRVPLEIPCGKLSRGQKAQLSLTLALGPGPELLVLDDPTLGLDAVARHDVYDELLCELAERGTTVLIATHDLAGIEGIADRVGILHGGRLLVDASLEDLKARYHKVSWAPFQALQAEDLAPYGPLRICEGSLGGEAVLSQGDPRNLLEADGPDLQVQALSLEELFVALVGAESEVAP
jgi:ABC-2 type transport system ATP-binding protein